MTTLSKIIGTGSAALALLLALADPPHASAAESALAISPAGAPELVFQWSRDACARDDIPDVPARAFRDAAGQVHLIASHYVNRAEIGPDLHRLKHDCRIAFRGAHSPEPRLFDDRAWLSSFYTLDGKSVFALLHMEYHGHLRRDLCPSGKYSACWANAVTWAMSDDGGKTFRYPTSAPHVLAALPYQYVGEVGRNIGYFNPSNIVRRDGYYYALIFAEGYKAQAQGSCLVRTDRLDDPARWRAWDGKGFSVAFANPYPREPAAPATHVCAPVGRGQLTTTVGSLTLHEPSGLYIAIMNRSQPPSSKSGIYAATSRDLIAWSAPTLVLETPTASRHGCGDSAFLAYPSLLDPDSPSRNFETTGNSAFVYATRFNMADCKFSMDRDLVRVPVRVTPAP